MPPRPIRAITGSQPQNANVNHSLWEVEVLVKIRPIRVFALILALGFLFPTVQPLTAGAQSAQDAQASPAGQPAAASPALDQTTIYGVPRSYALLKKNERTSFPDFDFFLGLNNARNNDALTNPPTFVPQCSTSGMEAPGTLANQIIGQRPTAATPIYDDVLIAYQNLTNLLYRFRICDFYVSVYAWNTRNTGHTAPFDFTWRTGCNSFSYESTMPPSLAGPAADILKSPSPTSDQLLDFLFKDEFAYAELYERVASCASIVAGLTYPPNNKRFICKYGSFLGAFITAYSAAFGHKWGGTNNATQSEVTAFGTVIIASPALCQK